MPTYLTLVKFTSEGLKRAPDLKKRQEEGAKLAEKSGIKSVASYGVLGPYDMMFIYEAPDEKAAAMLPLSMSSQRGDANTETWTLIPMEEFASLTEKLGR